MKILLIKAHHYENLRKEHMVNYKAHILQTQSLELCVSLLDIMFELNEKRNTFKTIEIREQRLCNNYSRSINLVRCSKGKSRAKFLTP